MTNQQKVKTGDAMKTTDKSLQSIEIKCEGCESKLIFNKKPSLKTFTKKCYDSLSYSGEINDSFCIEEGEENYDGEAFKDENRFELRSTEIITFLECPVCDKHIIINRQYTKGSI